MSRSRRIELFQAFRAWGFDHRGWSASTRIHYAQTAQRADLWLVENRHTSLVFATEADIRAFLFITPATARSRNGIRAALVAFFDFAISEGFRSDNPADELPRLKVPRSVPKALDVDQVRILVKVCHTLFPRDEALMLLLIYCGLRREEVRTLRWRDVQGEAAWLTFSGKGSVERAVPVHPDAARALMRWHMAATSADYVFCSPRDAGKPMSKTGVRDLVRWVGEEAHIPNLHPHVLRHTVATRMLEQGASLRDVQEFLGHASPNTTAIYTRVRPANLEEAASRLDFDGMVACTGFVGLLAAIGLL